MTVTPNLPAELAVEAPVASTPDILGDPIEILPDSPATIDLSSALPGWVDKIPNTKLGFMYNLNNKNFSQITTFELASWKKLNLEGAISTDNAAIGATVSYPIVALKDLGVNVPVLDWITCNVGFTGAYGLDAGSDSRWVYGPSVTLIDLKW